MNDRVPPPFLVGRGHKNLVNYVQFLCGFFVSSMLCLVALFKVLLASPVGVARSRELALWTVSSSNECNKINLQISPDEEELQFRRICCLT